MNRQNAGYIHDVDRLIEQTPLDLVLSHYGLPIPASTTGEHRIKCPFSDSCSDSQYGNLTINLSDPARVVFCHSCEVRGNLLTLVHGLETNRPPTGGRLRGQEFKSACNKLKQINEGSDPVVMSAMTDPDERSIEHPFKNKRNIPLEKSDNENARSLADLYEDLIVDVESMPPEAAAYFRKRPWLTSEVCVKWGIGYLPQSGRSMFRGWIVYTHRNQRGDVLTYSGRDPKFEVKWNRWLRDGKPETKKPMKHKYVKGYHKGSELFGQHASRLQEPGIAESLSSHGLFIVEGMNDVVRLDTLGVASVGICSNRPTENQVQKISGFAKDVANNKVVLMPDCDDEGEAGFKDLMWKLAEQGVDIILAWSRQTVVDSDVMQQPEQIDEHLLKAILSRISRIDRSRLSA